MPKPTSSRNRPRQSAAPKAPATDAEPLASEPGSAGSAAGKILKIAGLPAVKALFDRAPDRVLRLFYEDRLVPRVGGFCADLARSHRPYRRVDAEELAQIAGTALHGGIVAVAEPPVVLPFDPAAAAAWAEAGEPLFILDGVGNPHNLGAIARTLAFLGYRRLVISGHAAQAGLSDAAHRVAEGGLEYLRIFRADPLPKVLRRLAAHYRVVGTALGRGSSPESLDADPRPVALVLGNEEIGLPATTLEACETLISLPGCGSVQSLNVSATAAILAYLFRPHPRSVSFGIQSGGGRKKQAERAESLRPEKPRPRVRPPRRP